MTTTNRIAHLRNDITGELAPPHILGTDDKGRTLYLAISGWTPVNSAGEPVDCEADADGNLTVEVRS